MSCGPLTGGIKNYEKMGNTQKKMHLKCNNKNDNGIIIINRQGSFGILKQWPLKAAERI